MQQQTENPDQITILSASSNNYFIPLEEIITLCFKTTSVFLTDTFEKYIMSVYQKIMSYSKMFSVISTIFSKAEKVLAANNSSDCFIYVN